MIWRLSKTHLHLITRDVAVSLDIYGPNSFCMWFCVASEAAAFFKGIKVSLKFSSFPSQLWRVCFILSFRCWRIRPSRVQMDARYSRKKKKKRKKCGQSNRGESCWLRDTSLFSFFPFFPFFFLKKYFHPPSVIDKKRPRRPTYMRASRWPSHVMAALSPHVVTGAPTSPSPVFFFSKRDWRYVYFTLSYAPTSATEWRQSISRHK